MFAIPHIRPPDPVEYGGTDNARRRKLCAFALQLRRTTKKARETRALGEEENVLEIGTESGNAESECLAKPLLYFVLGQIERKDYLTRQAACGEACAVSVPFDGSDMRLQCENGHVVDVHAFARHALDIGGSALPCRHYVGIEMGKLRFG